MNIAILGAGNVGTSLGRKLAGAGHSVSYGVRDVASEKARRAAQTARVVPVSEAVTDADIVLIAVPWAAVEPMVRSLDLSGRIVVDATNAYHIGPEGVSGTVQTSCAELIQQWAPAARVVKAFNQTGFNNLADPDYGAPRPVMFVCGNDASATEAVCDIAEAIGFDARNAGGLGRRASLGEPRPSVDPSRLHRRVRT